jgi:hypothetical protein
MFNLTNISNDNKLSDWLPIIAAVVFVDALFILFFRDKFKNINTWYSDFGILAVIADCVIILLVFAIARYVSTRFNLPFAKSITGFFVLMLLLQIIHDIVYYFVIVLPLPKGQNKLIDFMKIYGAEGRLGPIIGDSILVLTMTLVACLFASRPPQFSIFMLLLGIYILPYVL